nr:DUF1003 domain-containing protein [Mesorhizobium alhagi]
MLYPNDRHTMQRSRSSSRQPPGRSREEAAKLGSALEHNIRAMVRRRDREAATAGFQERLAEIITAFTGSMTFVYLHLAAVTFWIGVNTGWLPVMEPWDPSFVILAMTASVEAIFLTSFVLISQNRMAENDDRRADLNLQISLLSEHEVTRLITMVSAITNHLGLSETIGPELDELQKDVDPETVLDEIESSEQSRD